MMVKEQPCNSYIVLIISYPNTEIYEGEYKAGVYIITYI